MFAVVICRMCRPVKLLYLPVVISNKSSINPVTNTDPMYSHYHVITGARSRIYLIGWIDCIVSNLMAHYRGHGRSDSCHTETAAQPTNGISRSYSHKRQPRRNEGHNEGQPRKDDGHTRKLEENQGKTEAVAEHHNQARCVKPCRCLLHCRASIPMFYMESQKE